MKFRKKPVVIDAIQWTGTNIDEIKEFTKGVNIDIQDKIGGSSDGCGYPQRYIRIAIKTIAGEMIVRENEWIIKGVKGEFYPITNDILWLTHEKVEE